MRSGIKDISVVVPVNSPIPDILLKYYVHEFTILEQEEPTGVPTAISLVLPQPEIAPTDTFIVVYCDNVYALDHVHCPPVVDAHTVMMIVDPIKAKELSKYSDGQWVRDSKSATCIAGWMQLSYGAVQQAHHFKTTEGFLNVISADPYLIKDPDWWDIGTLAAYREYWSQWRKETHI
jgi:hypothetical protein